MPPKSPLYLVFVRRVELHDFEPVGDVFHDRNVVIRDIKQWQIVIQVLDVDKNLKYKFVIINYAMMYRSRKIVVRTSRFILASQVAAFNGLSFCIASILRVKKSTSKLSRSISLMTNSLPVAGSIEKYLSSFPRKKNGF